MVYLPCKFTQTLNLLYYDYIMYYYIIYYITMISSDFFQVMWTAVRLVNLWAHFQQIVTEQIITYDVPTFRSRFQTQNSLHQWEIKIKANILLCLWNGLICQDRMTISHCNRTLYQCKFSMFHTLVIEVGCCKLLMTDWSFAYVRRSSLSLLGPSLTGRLRTG